MKKIVTLCFVIVSSTLFAQRSYQAVDVALAGGKGFSPALSYTHLYGVGAKGKFKVGWGIRLTSFFASSVRTRTAPATLTSGKQGLAALFSEDIANQIDTLTLDKAQTNALNASIHLQYSVVPKLEVGFNIDAIGFTFGGSQTGKFIANQSDATGKSNNGQTISARPTAFNLLLISDSDYGSLNSELYARYWASDKIGIRAGLSFQFSEYTTNRKVAFDNDRFRSKTLLPMLAVSYRF
ncbi:MAG: hypothetical protein U0Y10_06105 [Spirosomataceae bacterium]